MPQPHALIVDDSKTAQVRLRKMLERYELDIDTATSAEEALSYLSYKSPAVVFMDHHMEGMDGLEALRIMKSNPTTAMIPVIMYTSEKGDVYVGQARAMGALDILSKEVVKPSSLAKVLSSLNIAPRGAAVATKNSNVASIPVASKRPSEAAPGLAPTQPAATTSAELQAVRSQIARLFEIHIADVRQQVADSTKFIVRRLSGDIEDRLARAKADGADLPPPEPPPAAGSGWSVFFSALMLLGLLAVAFQVVSSGREQRQLTDSLNQLAALTQKQGDLLQDLTLSALAPAPAAATTAVAPTTGVPEHAGLLEAVSAAANINPMFAYGQPALGDERTPEFAQLLGLLDAARYTGTVFVDVHFGNFCVVQGADGAWVLPDAGATLADCALLADLNNDFPVENQLSLGFVRFLQTQPALAQGRLHLELNSRGAREPRYAYPMPTPDTLAAEWNARAQRNNRITLAFEAAQAM